MSNSQTEPAAGFAGFKLDPMVHRGITAAGFVKPRPIQERTIPAALEGRDILGLAQTGTGKTAAFALPLLEGILATRAEGPRALVVAPTRELASQISEEIRLLAQYTRIQVATLFGGVSMAAQLAALRKRPEIIVACPGRLLDLYRQGAVRLNRVSTLVLDEADHMFDMGFLPDIRRILAALPERRQNLLFSATMPQEIRRLANGLLRDPHVVELNHSKPIDTIEHSLFSVEGVRKFELLERVLAEDGFVSAIVFTRTKHRAKRLAKQLDSSGHRAVALQGNMSQNQRQRAMEGFRARRFHVLVATDIAARGIDVEGVSHVVNFDMPNTPDGYTHRIGRTGRAERQGRAYTFVTPEDHALLRAVERRIGATIPRQVYEGFGDAPVRKEACPERRPASRPRPGSGPPRHRRGRTSGRRNRKPGAQAGKVRGNSLK
jgi:ATP-dependent RNA helicase RhlE